MLNSTPLPQLIGGLLKACRLAVLATERNGQPHASLIVITPFRGYREIIFATYKNTRKYENLRLNSRVALLIQGEDADNSGQNKTIALTAFGRAAELELSEHEEAVNVHREKHPDLTLFLESSDFVLFRIRVEAYQIVNGIDDVTWFKAEDFGQ